MAIIVQKFGGTSVADIARIRNVAKRVQREVAAGNNVAVIVSAMAGVTDQLVGYVREVSPLMDEQAWANYDQVVSSGEQITSGLLALCLSSMGVPARAFSGWQLPMHTDNAYGKARIQEIETDQLHACFAQGKVAVVAGFQGVSEEGRTSTLGRGGSDTSAVAIAAAIEADRCDIYTDVEGVYTADPRIVTKARKLERVAYEEMLELASQGSKVLQTRSVAMGMNHGVKVQVLSSFSDVPGTLLVDEEELMEKHKVTGIAYSRDDARITLTNLPNKPGVSAAIFGPLADANINVDMIVQNVTEDGKATDLTFTVPRGDLSRAEEVLVTNKSTIEYDTIHSDAGVAKISVIGVGMRSHAGVAQTMFCTLAEKGINIIVISTSEIKISVLIEEAYTELAIRSLHTAYGLDAEE
ncbi:MAG: aspartate kinase [Alphaproteobacteria bacterium]|nr:aspartate kinase [Alphaproteobacteria bacterium]